MVDDHNQVTSTTLSCDGGQVGSLPCPTLQLTHEGSSLSGKKNSITESDIQQTQRPVQYCTPLIISPSQTYI